MEQPGTFWNTTMTSETVTLINLPYWETGRLRVRFLYLVGSSVQLTKPSTEQEPTIPLFLGADLLLNTDVRVENHPRYHSKFAKRGLATKVLFSPEFRFQGLRVPSSSNGLWFYSVDGVFRVAFELRSKPEQLAIVESFQELWKSRMDDEQLNPSYNVTALHPPDPGDPETPMRTHLSEPCGVDTESADHDYCSARDGPCRLAKTLRDMGDQVERSSLDAEQERSVTKLVDHVRRLIEGRLDEDGLTDAVMTLLGTQADLCVYSSVLLRALACWLGRCFRGAHGDVSRRVEGFKLRNIEHVRDLPPAEDLATRLFPEPMRSLLIHWMGFSEEEEGAWQRNSEYPIILLILEFTNHNLITGVAHVLYSSLICKDTPRHRAIAGNQAEMLSGSGNQAI